MMGQERCSSWDFRPWSGRGRAGASTPEPKWDGLQCVRSGGGEGGVRS